MKIDVNDKIYDIGSKYYPVKNKDYIKCFTFDNTNEVKNTELADFINGIKFRPGFCYSNADIICKSIIGNKLKIDFYSGWIFIYDREPLHHAWAVYDGNIIDVNFRKSSIEILKDINYTNENWRDVAALRIKAAENKIPLSEDCIMGKVFDYLVYVGTKDEVTLAKTRYNVLIDKFPDHKSYQHKGNPRGMTEFQKKFFTP